MSVIAIFSGIFCSADAVVRDVMDSTGYRMITDGQIIAKAAETSGMPENKVQRAFSAKTSVFNKFTHEKEQNVARIRAALGQMIQKDNLVYNGFATLLLPRHLTHVLKVCLVSSDEYRITEASQIVGMTAKDADKFLSAPRPDFG